MAEFRNKNSRSYHWNRNQNFKVTWWTAEMKDSYFRYLPLRRKWKHQKPILLHYPSWVLSCKKRQIAIAEDKKGLDMKGKRNPWEGAPSNYGTVQTNLPHNGEIPPLLPRCNAPEGRSDLKKAHCDLQTPLNDLRTAILLQWPGDCVCWTQGECYLLRLLNPVRGEHGLLTDPHVMSTNITPCSI